mgnify:FL=1
MAKENKKTKHIEKIMDINEAIKKIPFPICYYTEVILRAGLIEPTDIQLPCYEKFLSRLEKEANMEDLQKVLSYNVHRILNRKWIDGSGFKVSNRYTYFRNSVLSGFARLKADEEWLRSFYEGE